MLLNFAIALSRRRNGWCEFFTDSNDPQCRSVRAKPVGYDRSRSPVTLHCTFQELQRGPAIPALRGENLKHLAFVIHRPPEIMCLAVDLHEDLVKVPSPSGI